MRVANQCIAAVPPSSELIDNNPALSFAEGGYDSDDLRGWLASRGTERMFSRFKDWPRVATRFDRNIRTFVATIAIAAIVIWWLK